MTPYSIRRITASTMSRPSFTGNVRRVRSPSRRPQSPRPPHRAASPKEDSVPPALREPERGTPHAHGLGEGGPTCRTPGLPPPAPQAGAYLTAGARCSHPGAQALLPHGPGAPLSGPEGGREERDCEHMRRVTAKTLSGRPAR